MAMLIEDSLFEMLEAEPEAPLACPTCDSSPVDFASIVYPITCPVHGCGSKIKDLDAFKKHVRNALRTASSAAKHDFLKAPLLVGSRAKRPKKLDAGGNLKPSTASVRESPAKGKLLTASSSAHNMDPPRVACVSQPKATDAALATEDLDMSCVDSLAAPEDVAPIVERVDVDPRVVFAAEETPSGELAAQYQSPDSPGPDPGLVARFDLIRTANREANMNSYADVQFTPHPDPVVPQATARRLTFADLAVDHTTTRLDDMQNYANKRRAANLECTLRMMASVKKDHDEVDLQTAKKRIQYATEQSKDLLGAFVNANR